MEIKEDNQAVVTFQNTTVPNSKLKGVVNLKDGWIRELKDAGQVVAVKVETSKNIRLLHVIANRIL